MVKCLNVVDIIKVTSLHNSDIIKSFVGGVSDRFMNQLLWLDLFRCDSFECFHVEEVVSIVFFKVSSFNFGAEVLLCDGFVPVV